MKKILVVLLLLAFVSCEKDFKDIAKCIYTNPKVISIALEVMEAIKTKDFSKLIPRIKDIPDLIEIIMNCIKDDEVTLKSTKAALYACTLKCQACQNPNIRRQCINNCYKNCQS